MELKLVLNNYSWNKSDKRYSIDAMFKSNFHLTLDLCKPGFGVRLCKREYVLEMDFSPIPCWTSLSISWPIFALRKTATANNIKLYYWRDFISSPAVQGHEMSIFTIVLFI